MNAPHGRLLVGCAAALQVLCQHGLAASVELKSFVKLNLI